jgi:hypothetical protein
MLQKFGDGQTFRLVIASRSGSPSSVGGRSTIRRSTSARSLASLDMRSSSVSVRADGGLGRSADGGLSTGSFCGPPEADDDFTRRGLDFTRVSVEADGGLRLFLDEERAGAAGSCGSRKSEVTSNKSTWKTPCTTVFFSCMEDTYLKLTYANWSH